MKNKFFPVCLLLMRITAGGIFAVSGFMKLIRPASDFLSSIQSYEILNGPNASFLAQTMPWFEFFFGLFLILGLWTTVSVIILWAFNSVFIIVLTSALIRALPIQSCGCFGESVSLTPRQTLFLDAALWFFFAALAAFPKKTRQWSLDSALKR